MMLQSIDYSPTFLCFIVSFFLLAAPALSTDPLFGTCVAQNCGTGPNIRYPFRLPNQQPLHCGYPGFKLTCKNKEPILEMFGSDFIIRNISYEEKSISVVNNEWIGNDDRCPLHHIHYLSFNRSAFRISEANLKLFFFFNCIREQEQGNQYPLISCNDNQTHHSFSVLNVSGSLNSSNLPRRCESSVSVPVMRDSTPKENYRELLGEGFLISWIAPSCSRCLESGGQCGFYEKEFKCFCRERPHLLSCRHNKKGLAIKVAIPVVGGVLICATAILCFWYRKRLISSTSSKLLSRAFSSDPPLRSDLEKSDSLYITHVFEYKELEEATNNFDPSKELGDGGFGIVYHGKLHDGRNVAVKRLYENNCRCVEQFKNEIKILSQLRHQNLVTLYGCSSRHSRELLLVYEFIPNGTVADHLHGDCAKPGALIWPTRMSIAIETADALKYLHAVEIIHRDVKTNNILLDNNFHVKVADFGLSRLFPTNVTHISTAPQGTPGYVDPDYHRCYQLTDKSDVYSFGVVLIELISSKPAVDITRHRHDINLANMALNKIHNSALNELVDPSLGFDSNYGVRRMITSVAELAFRCLQDEKESRPSMEEVLEQLIGIESEEYNVEKVEVNTAAGDEALQKKTLPLSPDTVTEAWESKTTTPNASG